MENERRNRVGVFLNKKEEVVLLARSIDGTHPTWTTAEDTETTSLDFDETDFVDHFSKYSINKRKLNSIVGYVIDFKGQDLAFYYKDIRLKRNKRGRRCDRSGGKAPIVKILNEVVGSNRYSEETMYSGGLCVIMEIVLRHYQKTNKDGLIYTLSPEQAIRSAITSFSLE